ncbi:hypothetical protein [Pseudonocardia sp.]|uniref:hypothetical protein n=1 Tax=Pseudonocardia sp. TaxID=60912 RepID=UPI00260E8251|nr:hypothetical protein [Pseudonocardia sp.]
MRTRLAVLVACVVIGLLTAWYAGSRFAPPEPGPTPGTVRLGPESGEQVAAYLARLPTTLPPPGTAAYALVQFRAELTGADALAVATGAAPETVVFRVPRDRVQTALRFEPIGSADPRSVELARERARLAAVADAGRLTGRAGDVAAAEAAALADPACPCVVAMVVRGDRAALDSLAAGPQVRAVHAAPADARPVELALSPLLPAQREAATPVPDDGPLPPA